MIDGIPRVTTTEELLQFIEEPPEEHNGMVLFDETRQNPDSKTPSIVSLALAMEQFASKDGGLADTDITPYRPMRCRCGSIDFHLPVWGADAVLVCSDCGRISGAGAATNREASRDLRGQNAGDVFGGSEE